MRKTTAYDRAVEFVRELIGDCEERGVPRLPGIRALCTMAGVSHVTMHRAVSAIADTGELIVVHGKGIRLASFADNEPKPLRAVLRPWERVYNSLEADIRSGVYVAGSTLPPPKQLRVDLGVCHATLRRALDQLHRDGLVERHKRTYRVFSPHSQAQGNRILLVVPCESGGSLTEPTARSKENLRSLEFLCSRNGLGLQVVGLHSGSGTLMDVDGENVAVRSLTSLLGACIWAIGASRPRVLETLSELVSADLPVALLDENGSYSTSDMVHRRTRLFSMGFAEGDGRIVGRHLRRLGHRSIVYISPVHEPRWSQNRLTGVRGAYADAVGRVGVRAFTHDAPFPPQGDEHMVGLLEQSVRASIPGNTLDPVRQRLLQAVHEERVQIASRVRRLGFEEGFEPLFRQALAVKDATAWVTATDQVALAAVNWLRSRRVRVPDDISVIGFDDGLEAYYNKLSSYNFNAPAVMQAMLTHILQPERGGDWSGRVESPIAGFVSERSTTAAPVG